MRGLVVILALVHASAAASWDTALPEEVGIDSAVLAEMIEFARERKIPVHSVQLVRRGQLILDCYFHPYNSQMRHDVASVTKSVTSTLVGLAIARGNLRDVKEPVLSFFTNYAVAHLDARKRRVTIEHLLTMQAGWDCGFEPKEARLFEMRRTPDWLQFMLDLPMIAEPGARFAYCSGNCHLLSGLITKTTGTNALAFAQRELFAPLGISDVAWPADSHGHSHGWGDLQLHPPDMLKLGQLFLQRGRWDERQVVPQTWVRDTTRIHVQRTSSDAHYGYFWWMPGKKYSGLFEAVGRGGQRITVWPAKELVLVFTGGGFDTDVLSPFILKALKSDKPLPPNPEAGQRLREQIRMAARTPAPQAFPKLPPLAARISGKAFRLSANSMGLSAVTLHFDETPEAQAELVLDKHRLTFPLGLDGVERFSPNAITGLPHAAKGEWQTADTFLLELDLVGGIDHYRLKLKFSQDGKSLKASLTERTGLNDEQFDGQL